MPPAREITADYDAGSSRQRDHARRQHRSACARSPPTTIRPTASASTPTCSSARPRGEVPTGLLYVDKGTGDMHDLNATTDVPLAQLPYEKLCPGNAALDKLQEAFR